MTFRTQQRDPQGHFIQSVQPTGEQPPQITLLIPSASEPNLLQCIILAARTPLSLDVLVSENIANITSVLRSLTDFSTPTTPQQAAIQDPVIRYVPLPHYVTDPPLPCPDFEAPGTNASSQHQPSPRQAKLSDNPPL